MNMKGHIDIPDYEQVLKALDALGDPEISDLIEALSKVFGSSRFRPRQELLEQESAIFKAVEESFPTPFGLQVAKWTEFAKREPPQSEREHFAKITDCWRQIVQFLPLVLIAALSRIDIELLQRELRPTIDGALRKYQAFYTVDENEKQAEGRQFDLHVHLLKVFRELSKKNLLDAKFIFTRLMQQPGAPLGPRKSGGFNRVIPERFDAIMLMLHESRNRFVHDDVATVIAHQAAEQLPRVMTLIKWCMLDILSMLTPMCSAFNVSWVEQLEPAGSDFAAITLDFAGLAGPIRSRYRLSREVALGDDNVISRYRVYLIATGKRWAGTSVELLAPGDFLDSTPFLIVDRLGSGFRLSNLVDVFGLQKYLEQEQKLWYTEFQKKGHVTRPRSQTESAAPEAGSSSVTEARDSTRDWLAEDLLKELREFKNKIEQFTARVELTDNRRVNIDAVRAQFWRISKDYLATLTQVAEYDENGTRPFCLLSSELRPVYNEDLFVEPDGSEAIASFLASNSRALILEGGSGSGKSNLLVHHYFAALRERRMAAFLTGRRLNSATFRDAVLSALISEVAGQAGAFALEP